jgi:hypothetical protein
MNLCLHPRPTRVLISREHSILSRSRIVRRNRARSVNTKSTVKKTHRQDEPSFQMLARNRANFVFAFIGVVIAFAGVDLMSQFPGLPVPHVDHTICETERGQQGMILCSKEGFTFCSTQDVLVILAAKASAIGQPGAHSWHDELLFRFQIFT